MKIIKKLVLVCIIILMASVLFSSFLIKLQKEPTYQRITNAKLTNWYNNDVLKIIEIQKPKVIEILHSGMTARVNRLVNKVKDSVLEYSFDTKEYIDDHTQGLSIFGIRIGDLEEKVLEKLGEPARKDASKYGFQWYIYNKDYSRYLQVGIYEGRVVGLFTNSLQWHREGKGNIGSNKEEIISLYGEPLSSLKKGNTIYHLNSPEENYTYLINDTYGTFFFDLHDNNRVTAIQLIDKNIEENLQSFYGVATEELRISFEKQLFDLANSSRVRFGLLPLQWEEKAAIAARKQSIDMGKRNFFSHENPDGEGPSDRLDKEGISWRKSGENIAAGQTSAIFAHENWMNSLGHRENILGDFERLGVGVYFGGEYRTYYTQKFFTPR